MTSVGIPRSPEDLTPQWLTAALRSTGTIRNATVVDAPFTIIGAGAGFIGQLCLSELTYDTPEEGAPRSLIGKFPTLDPAGREIGNLFRFYEREARFYAEIAGEIELRTPRAYYNGMDLENGEFALLIEDMAPAVVGDHLESCAIDLARLAIHEIAKFHATWWQSPRLDALDWMPAINDPVNLSAEAQYLKSWGPFAERFGDRIDPKILEIGKALGPRVGAILHKMATLPPTIVHGDYRLDNLFFGRGEDGRPTLSVVDWQISNRGPGVFDAAYLMAGNLTTEARRANEMALLREYHSILVERGVKGYSFDDCLADYRLCVLFCLAYNVIGSGNLDMANDRGMDLWRAWLDRNSSAILDHNAAELLPA